MCSVHYTVCAGETWMVAEQSCASGDRVPRIERREAGGGGGEGAGGGGGGRGGGGEGRREVFSIALQ